MLKEGEPPSAIGKGQGKTPKPTRKTNSNLETRPEPYGRSRERTVFQTRAAPAARPS